MICVFLSPRRLDPYRRSCTILISLFAVGFVLIVIIVLSLIPIYISRSPQQTSTSIQTTRKYWVFSHHRLFDLFTGVLILNYNLQLKSSPDIFDPRVILSDTTNRVALQAALTSMLQKDSITSGSIVEIASLANPTRKSSPTHRQTTDVYNITLNLNVTYQKICTATCGHQYEARVGDLLSNPNRTTSSVRYQRSNSSQIYWFNYQLPSTIKSGKDFPRLFHHRSTLSLDTSLILVDPKNINSILNTLVAFDNQQNQPIVVVNSTSMPIG